MEPLEAILVDLAPQRVLELGRDRAGRVWMEPASPDARVVQLVDRDPWAQRPADLALELAPLHGTLDLVVDHATDDVSATIGVFEVVFAGVRPGGWYVIDAGLPGVTVLDLMMATIDSEDVIETVTFGASMVLVQRGTREHDSGPLSLAELSSDPFGVVR